MFHVFLGIECWIYALVVETLGEDEVVAEPLLISISSSGDCWD